VDATAMGAALEPSRFIGRAAAQVDDFLAEVVRPLLAEHTEPTTAADEVRV